jgi:hypothetical protein
MPSAVIAIQWNNYAGTDTEPGIFRRSPLTYNSRQDRLSALQRGDRLWLVACCPDDHQYYFVGRLVVDGYRENPPGSPEETAFGAHALLAERTMSADLGKTFPAEGLLRALQFQTGQPIKYGANVGQSLQTLRLLNAEDEAILDSSFQRLQRGESPLIDQPFGLWTKCDRVFCKYFTENWAASKKPLAFMLYDPPPALPPTSPVFIHSDKMLRVVARFVAARYVAAHRFTASPDERVAAREWFWQTYRRDTVSAPTKSDFDSFWDKQNGVRAFFLMEHLWTAPSPPQFKVYGRAIEWGYPTGVGYRYLSRSQCALLLKCCGVPADLFNMYAGTFLG